MGREISSASKIGFANTSAVASRNSSFAQPSFSLVYCQSQLIANAISPGCTALVGVLPRHRRLLVASPGPRLPQKIVQVYFSVSFQSIQMQILAPQPKHSSASLQLKTILHKQLALVS